MEGTEKKYTILAVDDENANLLMLNRILSPDYTICIAKSGAEALRLAVDYMPDIILLDIVMPGMDGFEVLRALKESETLKDVPVIIITGLDNSDNEEKGFTLGASDYITKPFKAVTVKARVKMHIKKAVKLNMIEDDLVRISSIVEGSPQLILYMSLNGKIEYINPGAVETTGYTKEEIISGGLPLFIGPEELSTIRQDYLNSLTKEGHISFELPIRRKNGEESILSVSAFAAELHNGESGVGITARDQTVLKKAQRELLEAKKRIEQALLQAEYYNRAKSDFLSRMSHEMLTPLNAILGMTNIARTTSQEEKRLYCLDQIDDASHHLIDNINDMLDMAHIDAGNFDLFDQEFSLQNLIRELSESFAQDIKEKDIHFNIYVAAGTPDMLIADVRRLRKVLSHLIKNAIEYTPRLGGISISVSQHGEYSDGIILRFEICDNGVGISEEMKERLWVVFEQADNSITRRHGGIGMGLAISRRIIEMMGGSIQVESESGKGTRFIFTIKAELQAGMPGLHLQPADQKPLLAERRILIVDDVELNSEIIAAMLEDFGPALEYAKDGEEAVARFLQNKYDFILMDLHMPGMDGFEAARRIRASGRPGCESTPIIAVSADTGDEAVQKSREAGMNDYINKPVEMESLLSVISRYLS
ncbi:MAG: response regulator [Treponema sp.]|jgi:PAS domain S-box-containing protein|nr:response regulator [Treponema sp.]